VEPIPGTPLMSAGSLGVGGASRLWCNQKFRGDSWRTRDQVEPGRRFPRSIHLDKPEPTKRGLAQCQAPFAVGSGAARTRSGVWERPPAPEAVMPRPSTAVSYLWKWYNNWGQVIRRESQHTDNPLCRDWAVSLLLRPI